MKLFIILFPLLVLFASSASAQVKDNKLNADSLFVIARQEAINKNYEEAIDLTRQILRVYPNHTDARFLLARTYAWQQNFDAAIENISEILKVNPSDYEANRSLIDFYWWSGQYDTAITAANKALSLYPRDIGLLEKKFRIYMAAKEYPEAGKLYKEIKKIDPDHNVIRELRKNLFMNDYSNIFLFQYNLESFKEPYHRSWHVSSFGYGRKTSAGTFYGKIYLGDMVNQGENLFSNNVMSQYALELYPRLNKKNYFFLNYAFSKGTNFPHHRTGFEYYYIAGKVVELSIGYRYLFFDPDDADKVHIHIYTGALSAYPRKYWISFRPLIVFNEKSTSSKYLFTVRRFLQYEKNYLELSLGTGISPDNPAFYTDGQTVSKLRSWRGELAWKQRILKNIIIEIGGAYERSEYISNSWRNQLALRSSLSFVF